MKINSSLQRSNELTAIGINYLNFKVAFLDEMNKNKPLYSTENYLKYFNISLDDWNDWHWQLRNRITKPKQLVQLFQLSHYKINIINTVGKKYRWAVTPYYLSQIRCFNAHDPIYLQCIPQHKELRNIGLEDPMNEKNSIPAGVITRRYPDRVILNVTNCCATFCRHCQRRRNIGEKDFCVSTETIDDSINYIKNHKEIRDVLVTGGDPLTMEDDTLENILYKLRNIPSVEIIRIGTRTLATLPQRITPQLIKILKKYAPLYINTQFNHPYELTNEAIKSCEALANNGIILGNQMVFLKNINNDANVLQLLNQMLLKHKIRPYYIFHPKNVVGTNHFSISIEEGLNIYSQLRGNTSGLAIPAYILNAPNGKGKIPLNSQILELKDSEYKVCLSTWEQNKINVNLRST